MSSDPSAAAGSAAAPAPDPRRWRALRVLGLIQFMLVLDMTVVTVALPRISADLSFSASGLPWVINGYVVVAGGFLMLGGRLADLYGRRRLFLTGVTVFVIASAVCGSAVAPGMLIAGRFAQGVGQALATPAALGLIALLFPDMRERFKALSMWGGIAGIAGTLGPIISGVLTELVSWRWIFFLNLPIAIFVLVVAPRLVAADDRSEKRQRLDIGGAVTLTGGLVAIVYGLLQAATNAWGSAAVLVPIIGGIALLGLMVAIESRVASPLLPLTFLNNRSRAASNVTTLLLASAFFTFSFLFSLFLQEVLGYSPLLSGLATLPFAAALVVGIALGSRGLGKIGIKGVLITALLGSALGMFLLSGISPATSYVIGLLPGLLILGVFYGACFPATMNGAMHAVTRENSGLVSGVQSTAQQIGGALGVATLATLALRMSAAEVAGGAAPRDAVTAGYALSFGLAAGLLVLAALIVLVAMENIRPRSFGGPPPGQGDQPGQQASGAAAQQSPAQVR